MLIGVFLNSNLTRTKAVKLKNINVCLCCYLIVCVLNDSLCNSQCYQRRILSIAVIITGY